MFIDANEEENEQKSTSSDHDQVSSYDTDDLPPDVNSGDGGGLELVGKSSSYRYQASVSAHEILYDLIGYRCIGRRHMASVEEFIGNHPKKVGMSFIIFMLLSGLVTRLFGRNLLHYIVKTIALSHVIPCVLTINIPVAIELCKEFETTWMVSNFILEIVLRLILTPLSPLSLTLQIYVVCICVWYVAFTDAMYPKVRVLATRLGWSYCLFYYFMQMLVYSYIVTDVSDHIEDKIDIIKINGEKAFSIFSLWLTTTMNMLVFSLSFSWAIWMYPDCYVIWQSRIPVHFDNFNSPDSCFIAPTAQATFINLPRHDGKLNLDRSTSYHVKPEIEIKDSNFRYHIWGCMYFQRKP